MRRHLRDKCLLGIDSNKYSLQCAAFDPKSRILAAGCSTRSISAWIGSMFGGKTEDQGAVLVWHYDQNGMPKQQHRAVH